MLLEHTSAPTPTVAGSTPDRHPLVDQLHALAATALPRMYRGSDRLFAFTERDAGGRLVCAGTSERYSAIALIGLESTSHTIAPFDRSERRRIATALLGRVASRGLGDAALIAWAATLNGAPADAAWARIEALSPDRAPHATLELAWTLTALSLFPSAKRAALRDAIARRLMAAYAHDARVFPHLTGSSAARSHVACFADQVYPIQALAEYSRAGADHGALETASACADHICAVQGRAGQWWWHYDTRTGAILEEYPVYAIHQDAMAPMALFALARAGGSDHREAVHRGLQWLAAAPELNGGTLIDTNTITVWRKVARREPRKASRYLQAAASRWRRGFRINGLDRIFPPTAIDREDRPYHWGWFLYAWATHSRQSD